ncbi:MAG: hypothetical protein ACLFWL_18130 [Candidatus Brocadiia bacterium]
MDKVKDAVVELAVAPGAEAVADEWVDEEPGRLVTASAPVAGKRFRIKEALHATTWNARTVAQR